MKVEIHNSPISANLINEIQPFMAACWRDTYADTLGRETVERLVAKLGNGSLADDLPGIGETLVLIRDGGSIIATCIYIFGENGGAVWGLYIKRSYQRQGLGSQLLRIVAEAGEQGDTIQLLALQDSSQAINFYLRNQFVIQEQITTELVPGIEAQCLHLSTPIEALLSTIPPARALDMTWSKSATACG
ncbi:GNAT family N-acetyltransferase [Martelella alba]|uniref:GNAT family N-acetyltransferase n=1 Tax=Martelella alba TaxID=2590451 RepID=A0A506U731_9HYPH|nr:GNAT family N-acetyltransferase [Martelella alba]TPW28765.1 GNAT family N-acetyltransferase [Martelella alba]